MIDTLAVPVVHERSNPTTASSRWSRSSLASGRPSATRCGRPALSLPVPRSTSVAIDGVSHEFSSIACQGGCHRDPPQLKELCVVSHSSTPVRCTWTCGAHGGDRGDIECRAMWRSRIRSSHLHLMAQASSDGSHGRAGQGYVTPRETERGQPIGVIPGRHLHPGPQGNFTVEKTRVGQETEWESDRRGWTNGTIQPVEAVSQAAASSPSTGAVRALRRQSGCSGRASAAWQRHAERLATCHRGAGALRPGAQLPQGNDVTRVGQLVAMRQEELLTLRNFGRSPGRDQGEAGRAQLRHRRGAGDLFQRRPGEHGQLRDASP